MWKYLTHPKFSMVTIAVLLCIVGLQHYVYNNHAAKKNHLCEDLNLKTRLNQMTETAELLRNQLNAVQKRHMAQKKQSNVPKRVQLFERLIPATRTLTRDIDISTTRDKFQEKVTILIYGGGISKDCYLNQLKRIRSILPSIKVIAAAPYKLPENVAHIQGKPIQFLVLKTEGSALNVMISMTKTKYFMYISEGAVISEYDSPSSSGWLYNALNSIPELDFVGGSFLRHNASLKYAQLDIPCYRMKMCYWTFIQSYEYKYSVGDMMVCEDTSSSFMGRTASVAKVGTFDETLMTMVTTDFFFRAKNKAAIGLMPEIFLHVSKMCTMRTLSLAEESVKKQSFMDKYSLKRIRDSFGREVNYPFGRSAVRSSVVAPINYKSQGGVNIPQATETLVYLLKFFDDFFNSKNITYTLVCGVALGGIKTRGVLPWDTGDVDTGFFGVSWKTVHSELLAYLKERGVSMSLRVDTFSDGPSTVRSIIAVPSPVSHGVTYDLYSREYLPDPDPEHFMYVYMHGRYIPFHRSMFKYFRTPKNYGIGYLKMQNHEGNLKCTVKGHHACVPEAFSEDGGHWSDFYCD